MEKILAEKREKQKDLPLISRAKLLSLGTICGLYKMAEVIDCVRKLFQIGSIVFFEKVFLLFFFFILFFIIFLFYYSFLFLFFFLFSFLFFFFIIFLFYFSSFREKSEKCLNLVGWKFFLILHLGSRLKKYNNTGPSLADTNDGYFFYYKTLVWACRNSTYNFPSKISSRPKFFPAQNFFYGIKFKICM